MIYLKNILIIVFSISLLLQTQTSFAGKDYSGKYIEMLCSKENTEMCEGYLLGVLDISQSNPDKNLCICSKDMLCGMGAIDTKKLPKSFLDWSHKKTNLDGSSSEIANLFIKDTFSCKRPNQNDFLKQDK